MHDSDPKDVVENAAAAELEWEHVRCELFGGIGDLIVETGACKFRFELMPLSHSAYIEDPLLQQPGNPYVEAARLGLPLSVMVEMLEAWDQGEPLYVDVRIVGTTSAPWTWPDGPTPFDDLKPLVREVRWAGHAHPAYRAVEWAETASDEEVWDVLQHGGLGAKIGLAASQVSDIGKLAHGGAFVDALRAFSWAKEAGGDLGVWYLADVRARNEGRKRLLWTIQHSIDRFAGLNT